MSKLLVKKLHPNAKIPTRGSEKASGLDLYALEDTIIHPGQTKLIKTGIAFGIPEGFEIQIRARSGVSLKTKLRVSNSVGTVDQDYTGECSVLLDNIGTIFEIVKAGTRIAQAVLSPVSLLKVEEVDTLDTTKRGKDGFGSSGV